ncbi:hypothetical protein GOP47_0016966 [Adiantum capillus-veneris]|uniref:Uncharacterized protein n=1 Tax=Adiantum capillus-veneris TaxID=13818 RepID=A0A9D4ZDH4_ADICA|nr:hypothetical protein GOP47_0016966 [Adiantum capillus-veneris]
MECGMDDEMHSGYTSPNCDSSLDEFEGTSMVDFLKGKIGEEISNERLKPDHEPNILYGEQVEGVEVTNNIYGAPYSLLSKEDDPIVLEGIHRELDTTLGNHKDFVSIHKEDHGETKEDSLDELGYNTWQSQRLCIYT